MRHRVKKTHRYPFYRIVGSKRGKPELPTMEEEEEKEWHQRALASRLLMRNA
jgi:hypothetical protein